MKESSDIKNDVLDVFKKALQPNENGEHWSEDWLRKSKENAFIKTPFDIWKEAILNQKIDGGSVSVVAKELVDLYDNVHLVTEKEGIFEDKPFSCKVLKPKSVKEIKELVQKLHSENSDFFLFNCYTKVYYDSRMNELREYFLVCDFDESL